MKITTMPKQTAAELLLFLAENERFSSVSRNLGEGVKVEEVRALLRELARELGGEVDAIKDETGVTETDAWLSPKAKDVLSSLSPQEEEALLGAFGLKEE